MLGFFKKKNKAFLAKKNGLKYNNDLFRREKYIE